MLYAVLRTFDILVLIGSSYQAEGAVGITSYPVDVGIPGKGTRDIHPKIPYTCDRLQDLAMNM